ncbi:MAG: hypothetical protein KAT34_04755 [Candidatus Aminicenantes bacterium]|jgi:hypothetical protein|nr:hypothetical protein [Candidatus Aminicenantes bacterium]
MNSIFYFHGFASTEKSWKVQLLKKHVEKKIKIDLVAPTLPVNPSEVVKLFEQFVFDHGKPGLVIGSSLGGFYARYVSASYDIPAVLINPSIFPWRTLTACVGLNKRYYTGETFEWKSGYLDSLKAMNRKMKEIGPKHHNLHFFLASDDGILDHKKIPELFPGAASIRFYDNCKHSFERFPEIIPEIEKLL